MAKRTYKRRKKLIKPKFQMRVALCGLGISVVAVLLLMIMVNEAIMEFASNGWVDAAAMQAEWMNILLGKLLITMALLVPFTLALGVILTHRVAGPLYRFEAFLNAVMAGEHPEPCRLRQGDELMDFCELLNEVTEPLRNGSVPLPHAPESDLAELASEDAADEESTVESEPVEAAA
jgi:hypothetical protein